MESRIKVVLVAGNRLLRETLACTLRRKEDICVVAAVPQDHRALPALEADGCDVVVLDSVTTSTDLGIVGELCRAYPHSKLIVTGMEKDEELFLRMVRAGVTGYLLKDASAMDIAAAVRCVVQEEAVCPPHLCLSLFKHVACEWKTLPEVRVRIELRFTQREQQLVGLIARRMTNKEIAAQLNLSEQTVKNHIHRMLHKVGARDRLSIVQFCRQKGLEV